MLTHISVSTLLARAVLHGVVVQNMSEFAAVHFSVVCGRFKNLP
jgi:hypothetical protein